MSEEEAKPAALSVLIVEDEAVLALSLASVVEEAGHVVVGTTSRGARAIEMANRHAPDVILMDVRLANHVDGITAAEIIRARQPAEVIFITAYSDAAVAERIARLDAPLLSKPVNQEQLLDVLNGIAGRLR